MTVAAMLVRRIGGGRGERGRKVPKNPPKGVWKINSSIINNSIGSNAPTDETRSTAGGNVDLHPRCILLGTGKESYHRTIMIGNAMQCGKMQLVLYLLRGLCCVRPSLAALPHSISSAGRIAHWKPSVVDTTSLLLHS